MYELSDRDRAFSSLLFANPESPWSVYYICVHKNETPMINFPMLPEYATYKQSKEKTGITCLSRLWSVLRKAARLSQGLGVQEQWSRAAPGHQEGTWRGPESQASWALAGAFEGGAN